MKINYSVIVVLFFSFTSCTIYLNHRAKKNGLEGHFDKDYNWHQSPNMAYVSEREFLSVQKKFDSIHSHNFVPYVPTYAHKICQVKE